MKGLSVLFTIVLLVLANHLAERLKRAGALPTDQRPVISLAGPGAYADAGAGSGTYAHP